MTRALVLPALVLATALPLALAPASAATKDVQKLEKQLAKDKDAGVRARAAWDLGQIGATESVPALAAALDDSSGAVRANAAASLGKLGAASKPAIPQLKKALDDPYAPVVGNAARALAKLGTPKAQLIPAYRRILNGNDCKAVSYTHLTLPTIYSV